MLSEKNIPTGSGTDTVSAVSKAFYINDSVPGLVIYRAETGSLFIRNLQRKTR